jgi:small subunit ribosomal protein S9
MKQFRGTGRRKTSTAQVRLVPGSGNIHVNNKTFTDYFPLESYQRRVKLPFTETNNETTFDAFITVKGGGFTGQIDAAQLGIARALAEYDEELKSALKTKDLLTRDSRMVERKKYGQKKARKSFQFSKR